MKHVKLFEEYNNEGYQVYHGIHPKTLYEYIVVIKDDEVKGFATLGYRDNEMIKNKVYAIGTMYGPRIGDFLFEGFVKYYGEILPPDNISDIAKRSFQKKFDDVKWKKRKLENLGHYGEEEDYLNNIYNIDTDIDIKEIDDLENKSDIYKQINVLHKKVCDDLEANKEKFYTKGQSRYKKQ